VTDEEASAEKQRKMRRSTRLEAANGKKGARISEMIARHADHVRQVGLWVDWRSCRLDASRD
jgi:hypothetical protein